MAATTKKNPTCGTCCFLYTTYRKKGKCLERKKSTGAKMKACKMYREMVPFNIKFGGKSPRHLKFDASKPQAFVAQTSAHHILLVMWVVEHDGYGYWRVKMMGTDKNNEAITKRFSGDSGEEMVAFFGEASIVGANGSDICRSCGFEDDDEVDTEGNIYNKPVEIRIFPTRTD